MFCCPIQETAMAMDSAKSTNKLDTMVDSSANSANDFDALDDPSQFEGSNSGLSEELVQRVNDLILSGNEAFNDNDMDKAIYMYSKAFNLCPTNAVVLSNRIAAFCCHSQQLRNRPAALSEAEALLGLDPMKYAEIALKDAERLLQVKRNWPKSYYRQAVSLILLERYDDARESILSGLQIDPHCTSLQLALSNLDKQCELSKSQNLVGHIRKSNVERMDDFDCTLCLKLLYDPVTTPCGHTFCRSCLLQSMDHGNRCPMCRTVLLLSQRTYSLSVTLNNIIQKCFPEEYAERKSEVQNLTHSAKNILPLFVMDFVLPQQQLALNIFEPRYRLMIRRIMEGSHRMGMVGFDSSTNSIVDVGCEVEISECKPLPDGRFILQVEGRQRFHILNSWEQDGYRVAEIEWISDSVPEANTRESEELKEMTGKAGELARAWTTRAVLRNVGKHRTGDVADQKTIYSDILENGENLPNTWDAERFSFWLANRLKLRPTERLNLLRLTDTRERLSLELILLGSRRRCHV